MPHAVDKLPFVTVAWLTDQLIQHLTDEEKWWNSPYGFNLLATNDPDDDDVSATAAAPPAGYERLPMHEEVSSGE